MPRQPNTLSCDYEGCKNDSTERFYGEGHQGWGKLLGILWNDQEIYLCPEHLDYISKVIKPEGQRRPTGKGN